MIVDARKESGLEALQADVVIAGAGAAGITMALQLEDQGLDTIVLEAGGVQFEEHIQRLYEGESVGAASNSNPASDLLYDRLRFFGGSTNGWGVVAPP